MKSFPPNIVHSEADFTNWLSRSQAGASIEYHRGFLVLDRDPQSSSFSDSFRTRLTAIARAAYRAAKADQVCLVQIRLGSDTFSYRAIRRSCSDRSAPSRAMQKSKILDAEQLTGSPGAISPLTPEPKVLEVLETQSIIDQQIRRIRSRYAVTHPVAAAIAVLAFASGRRP